MIKTLQKVGIEGTYFNIIKAIYDQPTASIILNGEKLKAFFQRPETRQGRPFSPLSQHRFGDPSHDNQGRKIKRMQLGKEVEPSHFADDVIPYIENSKNATENYWSSLMNLVKLQDTKLVHRNPLHPSTLTMKDQKEKLMKQSHLPLQ